MPEVDPSFQMAATFAVIVVALALYTQQRVPLELTSLGVVCALLLLFHFAPVPGPDGANLLDTKRLLEGFANPALIAVLALLVIGTGLARTGILDQAAQTVFRIGGRGWGSIVLVLIVASGISGFLNNIPVVVIFIPILRALAERLGRSTSSVMMPLSFAAILGGMTTLIGSSTNLLVSSELVEVGEPGFRFFDFTVPGMVLAATGMVYVLVVAPRLLPVRVSPAETADGSGRHFIAQITVSKDSKLVGTGTVAGLFPSLPSMTVHMIQRGSDVILPPYEDVTVRAGDVLVVAATRKALTDVLKSDPGLLRPDPGGAGESDAADGAPRGRDRQMLVEVMVTPASRLIGQTLDQAHFPESHHCIVLGIRRRSRMIRAQVTQIHIEAGDVFLLQGRPEDIARFRSDPDVLLMEWSATALPSPHHARRAALIFLAVIVAAASGVVPIAVAAACGAGVMIGAGVLSVRRATQALDRKIVMMIGAALALGAALQETGGAALLADGLIETVGAAGPVVVLSTFFLLVAVLSNVISTKACAVLFTPIAVDIGKGLGVDPTPFAVAVVFAANCSFASPVGYQTNLLVMTPGQYRFIDFVRAGAPLIVVLWIAFSLFAPWYFGLW